MLRAGSSGDEVTALQKTLLMRGFNPGGVDGAFGAKTADALKRFQEKNGLDADGIAGPKTMEALEAGSQAPAASGGLYDIKAAAADAADDAGSTGVKGW